MATPLRVVDEGDPPSASSSISAAAKASRRDLLVAMRDHIAAEIDGGVPARDLASLSLRLMKIAEELEALGTDEEDDVADAADAPDESWNPS